MSKPKNILFIMCDQLRWDYLSCSGHPYIDTPNIDRIARQGVRFSNAYVQSPVCGSSRMSFYTGRYVNSHGASWNGIPLKVGEMTLGDYLRPQGMRTALVGKTHMYADIEGMMRLGISPDSLIGVRVSECGFDPYERDDGLHGEGPDGFYDKATPMLRYNKYLNDQGFDGDNPWHSWANSSEDEHGNLLSGWLMENANRPARIPEEHSETAYMTRRAMDFITENGDDPWCLHLSYIKPHWPYIAPAPYHNMYGPDDVIPVVRDEKELENQHPVFKEFTKLKVGRSFNDDNVRRNVIPAYMGLIKQIDDHIGKLWQFLEDNGRLQDTLIVFTSDHGDYLGDHWMGEKDLFHEPSVKIPLIIYDPSEEADSQRGTVCDELVESVDLAPTFLEVAGGEPQPHRLEGLSLLPLIRDGNVENWRKHAISENDFSVMPVGTNLGLMPRDSRMFMVFDGRYKFIYSTHFRSMLYDLEQDPDELVDLGESVEHEPVRNQLYQVLCQWGLRNSQRTTRSEQDIMNMRGKSQRKGIIVGFWETEELPPGVTEFMKDYSNQRN